MTHQKCGSKVFVDRVFSEKKHVELYCIGCGQRWMLDKEKNKLAEYLWLKEMNHANASVTTNS